MKITLNGVMTELTADEVISALLSDEAKGLWELKKALDKLEAHELAEPSDEDIKNLPFFSDEEINEMLSQTNELQPCDLKNSPALHFHPPKKRPFSLESDIKFTPSDEKSFDGGKKTFFEHDEVGQFPHISEKSLADIDELLNNNENSSKIEEKPSSDTNVPLPQKESKQAIQIKPKRKYHRRHKHNHKKVTKFVGKKEPKSHLKNDEDDPIIRPAVRPRPSSIEVNVI